MEEILVKQIKELRQEDYGYKAIAKMLGISRESVRYHCKNNGWMTSGNGYGKQICKTCGKDFYKTSKNQIFCSDNCRPYRNTSHKKESHKKEYEIECRYCGNKFNSTRKDSRFCNDNCKEQYHKLHCHKERTSIAVHEQRICPTCGKEFISKNAKSTYCSKKCYNKQLKGASKDDLFQKRLENAKSQILSKGFEYVSGFTNTNNSVEVRCKKCGNSQIKSMQVFRKQANVGCSYCRQADKQSKESQRQKDKQLADIQKQLIRALKKIVSEKERQNKYLESHKPKNCKWCESIFTPNHASQKICPECKSRRKEKRVPKEKRNTSLTWKALWNKGERNCKLCGSECNPNDYIVKIDKNGNKVKVVGESYPSLDHINPVFMGGGDDMDNVQLACFKCNSIRGVKDWQEYRRMSSERL